MHAPVVALWLVACCLVSGSSGFHHAFDVVRRPGGKDGHRISDRRRLEGFKEMALTNRENDGVYWTEISVGTPPQVFSVIVDTGSSTIAIPCAGCACGNHNHFDASKSSTVSTSRAGGYSQCYSEGSCNSGDILQDNICVGTKNCDSTEAIVHPFGCCKRFASAFVKQEADGIIGLSQNKNTLVADLRSHHKLDKDLFALCFGASTGSVAVGGYNEKRHLEPVQWTPGIAKYGEFYKVGVDRITLDGKEVAAHNIPSPIVDSGTTFTYVPRTIHAGLKRFFQEFCNQPGKCTGTKDPPGTPSQDKRDAVACYSPPENTPVEDWLATFPHIEIEFSGGARVCLPSEQYFFRSKGKVYCVGMFPDRRFIIGAISMAEFDVIFDLENSRVGWARANCEGPADALPSPVSCCGTCADHMQAKVPVDPTPHVETHSQLFDVTPGAEGRYQLRPKPDVTKLDGFTLKATDDLFLEPPTESAVQYEVCTDPSKPCLFSVGTTVTVGIGAQVTFGGKLKLETLTIAQGASVFLKPTTDGGVFRVDRSLSLAGDFTVDAGAIVVAKSVVMVDSLSSLSVVNGGKFTCNAPLKVDQGSIMLEGGDLFCDTIFKSGSGLTILGTTRKSTVKALTLESTVTAAIYADRVPQVVVTDGLVLGGSLVLSMHDDKSVIPGAEKPSKVYLFKSKAGTIDSAFKDVVISGDLMKCERVSVRVDSDFFVDVMLASNACRNFCEETLALPEADRDAKIKSSKICDRPAEGLQFGLFKQFFDDATSKPPTTEDQSTQPPNPSPQTPTGVKESFLEVSLKSYSPSMQKLLFAGIGGLIVVLMFTCVYCCFLRNRTQLRARYQRV